MEMNFIQRGIVSFLALLMFTTSACFAVDTHVCGDVVQSRSVFSNAESCEKMAQRAREANEELPECCKKAEDQKIKTSNSKNEFRKKPCCYNRAYSFKNDLNEDGQIVVPFLGSIDIILPEFFKIVEVEIAPVISTNNYHRGPPDPFLKRDIQSLYQVFLI